MDPEVERLCWIIQVNTTANYKCPYKREAERSDYRGVEVLSHWKQNELL